MSSMILFHKVKRSNNGAFPVRENVRGFRVWGTMDGERFDRTFPSAIAWRAWRNLQHCEVEVLGMQSAK